MSAEDSDAVDRWWAGLKPEARAWVYNTALTTAVDLATEQMLPPLTGGLDGNSPSPVDGNDPSQAQR